MDAMKIDRRQLSEYPFDGVFYEYRKTNRGHSLILKLRRLRFFVSSVTYSRHLY